MLRSADLEDALGGLLAAREHRRRAARFCLSAHLEDGLLEDDAELVLRSSLVQSLVVRNNGCMLRKLRIRFLV